jgi:hypothetical protein
MKQHRAKLRTAWLSVFLFLLVSTGCSKPPVFHIVARDEQADESKRYKIFLKGRELGMVTGSGTFEFRC